jgi:hypothetical protein
MAFWDMAPRNFGRKIQHFMSKLLLSSRYMNEKGMGNAVRDIKKG